MKKLAKDRQEYIEAVASESLNNVSAALLEKDEHLSDALEAIFKVKVNGLTLAFCGGSSLSKGFGIIERMSEDADLKIIIDDATLSGSRNSVRKKLSSLRSEISKALENIGLVEEEAGKRSLNENRYFASHWKYESSYPTAAGLRPHLLVEFTARTPVLKLESIQLLRLADRLTSKGAAKEDLTLTVSVAETVAEKALSFLRRFAQHSSGSMMQQWDTALVRHIYDVYCALKADPNVTIGASKAFPKLVETDVNEFGNQFGAFKKDPKTVMTAALQQTEASQKCISEYKNNLLPLVYGNELPNYQTAFSSFKIVSEELLATL